MIHKPKSQSIIVPLLTSLALTLPSSTHADTSAQVAMTQKTTAQLVQDLYRCVATSKEKPSKKGLVVHYPKGFRDDSHRYEIYAMDTYRTVKKKKSILTARELEIREYDRLEGTSDDIWHLTAERDAEARRVMSGGIYAQRSGQISLSVTDNMGANFDGNVDRTSHYIRKDPRYFDVKSVECFANSTVDRECREDATPLSPEKAQSMYREVVEKLLGSLLCSKKSRVR